MNERDYILNFVYKNFRILKKGRYDKVIKAKNYLINEAGLDKNELKLLCRFLTKMYNL